MTATDQNDNYRERHAEEVKQLIAESLERTKDLRDVRPHSEECLMPEWCNEHQAACVLCGEPVNHDPSRPRESDYPSCHRSCSDRQKAEYALLICVCGDDKNWHDGNKSLGKCRNCGWKFCPRFKLDEAASEAKRNAVTDDSILVTGGIRPKQEKLGGIAI